MSNKYYSVHDALIDFNTISSIACAIDTLELGKWDDFGRFIVASDEDKMEVRSSLKQIFMSELNEDIANDRFDVTVDDRYKQYTDILTQCGWNYKPDFVKIESDWVKSHAFASTNAPAPETVRRTAGEYTLIKALTAGWLGDDLLQKLMTENVNAINILNAKVSKTGYSISEKTLSNIYRKRMPK